MKAQQSITIETLRTLLFCFLMLHFLMLLLWNVQLFQTASFKHTFHMKTRQQPITSEILQALLFCFLML